MADVPLLLRAEKLLLGGLSRAHAAWCRFRSRMRPATASGQRGHACHCAPMQPHLLHSEALREAADFVVDFGSNVTHPDRPQVPVELLVAAASEVPDGAVVHVKADLLGEFVRYLLPVFPGRMVLVTGDSDASPDREFADLLEHPRILHWFAQNWDSPLVHPRLTRVPIGFDNPVYTKLEKRLGFLLAMARGRMPFDPWCRRNDIGDQQGLLAAREALGRPTRERPLRVLATFHQNQKLVAPFIADIPDRVAARDALEGKPWCHFVTSRIPQRRCWELHGDFAFEASPRGYGADCFRTWEALALGTIPIVRTSPLDALYRELDLPVVIVGSWDEVTRENLSTWHERLAGRFDAGLFEALTVEWWVERIRRARCYPPGP